MKKMFSLALALIMALALCVPAFAEETTGSITIANEAKTEGEYVAYKIFDVTYSGENYAYTISTESDWYDVVNSYANGKKDDVDGLTLTQATGDATTYVVSTTSAFSAPEFAGYLSCNRPIDATGVTIVDGKVEGLDLGYWFVTSNQGSLCNLTTTDPDATIFDKNYVPFDKVDDDESVEVGQVVHYTITGEVPDTTGFDYYLYEISDTMSEGLTFNEDVVITFNNMISLEANESWCEYTDDGFVLTMDLVTFFNNGNPVPAGWPITVTYSATVNEKAVSKISKNNAVLKYSNDPAEDTYAYTIPVEETVYTSKIVVDKYDSSATDVKLAGATFVLKNSENKYYHYEDEVVTWVDFQNATDYTTGDDGTVEFIGLADGTYYLIETAAPTGYNLLTEAVEVVIDGNKDSDDINVSAERVEDLTNSIGVANSSGTELPSTGGMGTTIFYTIGGVMMAAAVILFVTKKKLAVQE